MLYGLEKNRTDWFPEVLARRLRRRLVVIQAAKQLGRRELIGYDGSAIKMIYESAERAAAAFVQSCATRRA